MLYTVLDTIADTVNPTLGLLAVAQLLAMAFKRQWRRSGIYLATLLALTAVIYGCKGIDRSLFDFPYSTHSAFAICFCSLHAVHMPRFKFMWLGILAAYLGLILLQGYHSVLDIAVTLVLVGPLCFAIFLFSNPSRTSSKRS